MGFEMSKAQTRLTKSLLYLSLISLLPEDQDVPPSYCSTPCLSVSHHDKHGQTICNCQSPKLKAFLVMVPLHSSGIVTKTLTTCFQQISQNLCKWRCHLAQVQKQVFAERCHQNYLIHSLNLSQLMRQAKIFVNSFSLYLFIQIKVTMFLCS